MTSAQRPDVVVVGGANIDLLIRGPSLPSSGDNIVGGPFLDAPGGKGLNQAIGAARLGARVAFVARVGADDRGQRIHSTLSEERVDASCVLVDPQSPTGVAVLMIDHQGNKQSLSDPGANARLQASQVEEAWHRLGGAQVLLVQLEVPLDAVRAAIAAARRSGAVVVLDPAPARQLPDDVLAGVDLISPNLLEAQTLTGIRIRDRDDARRAAEQLRRRGAAAAVVEAPGGNLVVGEFGELWCPHLPVDVVDTTGAGDAFAAAMATCLSSGASIQGAATVANAAAALTTTAFGALQGLPRRGAVLDLLRRQRPAVRLPTRSLAAFGRRSTSWEDPSKGGDMEEKINAAEEQKHIQSLMDQLMELPFRAQQGILRTLAPKIISRLEGDERSGFLRDLNEEIQRADRGEPTYDYRPFDQSVQP